MVFWILSVLQLKPCKNSRYIQAVLVAKLNESRARASFLNANTGPHPFRRVTRVGQCIWPTRMSTAQYSRLSMSCLRLNSSQLGSSSARSMAS